MNIESKLNALKKSKFRSSQHLNPKEKEYVKEKGMEIIREHAIDFMNKRIKERPKNDTKQTPYHGHPVFVAQHACACCCRKCINKWYGIPKDVIISDVDINILVDVMMKFIESEIEDIRI